MLRLRCFWAVFLVLLLGRSDIARAEFTLDLSFSGVGTVQVISPPLSQQYFSDSSITVPNSTVLLVGSGLAPTVTGIPSSVTVPFGGDININLGTTLGTKFVRWSGSSIPFDTPEEQELAQDRTYSLTNSADDPKFVTANFSSAFADVEIDQVNFWIFGSSSPTPVSSWSFSGSGTLLPRIEGTTSIRIDWSSFAGVIDINSTNNVQIEIIDKVGNIVGAGFDLDVSPTAVPEPSSIVLMAVVAGGLCAARVRRKERGEHAARGVGGGERVGKDGESNAA